MGSCCSGNLCNVDLSNKTYFAPKIPRLAVLPDQSNNSSTEEATPGNPQDSLPAPEANKETPSVAETPSLLDHSNHDDHDHDHDHEHDHDDNDEVNLPLRNEYFFNAVKVEERKHQEQQTTYSSGVMGVGGSFLLISLLAGVLM